MNTISLPLKDAHDQWRLVRKHCQMVMWLAALGTEEKLVTLWYELTQISEPFLVRVIRILFELELGLILAKRLTNELKQEVH